jgi:uncharacterized protein
MNNVNITKQAYQSFAEGKVEEVLALFNPEIVWDECEGFPYIEGNGISVGPEAIVKDVFSKIPENFDEFNIDIDEIFGCDDRVVMVGHYTGVWKATGKPFKANAVHVWQFKDGKATHFFQGADTATIINS